MRLRIAVPAVLLVLAVGLVLPLVPTERVGPQPLGVDAVTAATTGIPSTGSWGGGNKDNDGPKYDTYEGQARFLKWLKGVEDSAPVLGIEVAPKVGQQSACLVVPNENERDKAVHPKATIVDLSKSLRIGDVVRITFAKPKGRYMVVDMARTEDSPVMGEEPPFVFDAMRVVRVDGAPTMSLAATREKFSFTFLLPNTGAMAAGRTPKPTPDETLSKAVGRFKRGDLIRLEYDTQDYQFVLTGIDVAHVAGTGTFVRCPDAPKNGVWPVTIRTSDGDMTMAVPVAPAAYGADAAAARCALTANLAPNTPVKFAYRREGGVVWLESVEAN